MSNYKGDDRMEKHYTPKDLIDELFLLKDKYVDFNITEYLENSAGCGNIIDRFDKDYIAFDIFNETNREDIKQCDYLKEKIEYKEGRVSIINPPFTKGLKFVYKSLEEGDMTIAILAVNSLLNIDYSKYWLLEGQIWKNKDFGSCKVSICIVVLRKRKEGDKYEYEN
jgi:hypothetical protein